jgi:hypothetical protein
MEVLLVANSDAQRNRAASRSLLEQGPMPATSGVVGTLVTDGSVEHQVGIDRPSRDGAKPRLSSCIGSRLTSPSCRSLVRRLWPLYGRGCPRAARTAAPAVRAHCLRVNRVSRAQLAGRLGESVWTRGSCDLGSAAWARSTVCWTGATRRSSALVPRRRGCRGGKLSRAVLEVIAFESLTRERIVRSAWGERYAPEQRFINSAELYERLRDCPICHRPIAPIVMCTSGPRCTVRSPWLDRAICGHNNWTAKLALHQHVPQPPRSARTALIRTSNRSWTPK